MKVGARKTLSDHCPNEGEKPKGARGGMETNSGLRTAGWKSSRNDPRF